MFFFQSVDMISLVYMFWYNIFFNFIAIVFSPDIYSNYPEFRMSGD